MSTSSSSANKGRDFFLNFTSAADIAKASKDAARGQSGTGTALQVFSRGDIRPDHVRAAFAYPFIYTPVKIGDRQYFEGANWEPISFGRFLETVSKDVKTVVLIDIVSKLERFLLREPRNLWDAFGLSIILPVVAHAKKELARFEKDVHDGYYKTSEFNFRFLKIEFEISDQQATHILDWSYSNMSTMFDIGCAEGEKFFQNHRDVL